MAYTDLLAHQVIQGIIDDLADVNLLPTAFRYVAQVPSVEADDGEVIARYNNRVVMADLIIEDQKSVVRASRPIRLQENDIPKYKHGLMITEAQQNILDRINRGVSLRRDVNLAQDYIARSVIGMRDGCYARHEFVLAAMKVDDFSYSSMGVFVDNVSWGMPSDLKVTPVHLWTDADNATPIADIMALKYLQTNKYGLVSDRITLSLVAFQYITQTAEFVAKAQLYRNLVALTNNNFPTSDQRTMETILGQLLNMTIQLDDRQTWEEALDGTESSTRYLPQNKVVLESSEADGNPAYWDWANLVVPETRPGVIPSLIGDAPADLRSGPITYATAADAQGNPPGQIIWGVSRGFPRKYKEACTAVITAW